MLTIDVIQSDLTQGRKGAEKHTTWRRFLTNQPGASAPWREHSFATDSFCGRSPGAVSIGLLALLLMSAANGAEQGIVRLTHDGHLKQRPEWSPDGSWLAFTRHQGTTIFLLLRSADGVTEKRLTTRKDPEFDAAWSPDGKRLAFCLDKTVPNQGDMDVYVIGADGEDLQPVLTSGGKLSHEEWPSWSPDGEWLALSSTRDGNQEIYVVRPSSKDLRRLTNDPAIDAHPAWSPDGKQIVFATSRFGDFELAIMDADGSHLQRLTNSRGLDDYPAWSPDGQRIAFTSNRDGNFEIYTCDRSGKDLRNETRNPAIDNFPAWSPAGELTFVSNREGGFELYALSAVPRH
jgi:TolB protein